MIYTYYEEVVGLKAVMCGKGRRYQVNLHDLALLAAPTADDPGYGEGLEDLVQRVNDEFATLGAKLLLAQRRRMEREGIAGADRLELTVLFTEKGIQPAFSVARARKERAPVPHKSTARRIVGLVVPARKETWTVAEPKVAKGAVTRKATRRAD